MDVFVAWRTETPTPWSISAGIPGIAATSQSRAMEIWAEVTLSWILRWIGHNLDRNPFPFLIEKSLDWGELFWCFLLRLLFWIEKAGSPDHYMHTDSSQEGRFLETFLETSGILQFASKDDKGKKVYQPTVFQMGFQRTDVALMSTKLSVSRFPWPRIHEVDSMLLLLLWKD